jgi:S1-C subfamily serine protease
MDEKFKNKINNCVVRIVAESININWNMPYLKESPSRGQGTGFFIDNKGHILTCAHVIDGAKNLYIEIPNISSNKYECDIIGICPEFDIGLIRCRDYRPKEYIDLGDSDKLKVESHVHVVGFPVSLSKGHNNVNNLKYTVGIIGGQQNGFIQTDSAINPGNSGGPLFLNNKVIGINSLKLVGESLENIGFSIPINNFKLIKEDLFKSKSKIVNRPDLLFKYNNTDKHILKEMTKNKVSEGIILSKIYEHSLLKKTSIKEGDIITEIDKYKLDNYGLTKNYRWIGTSIKIDILLRRFKNNQKINIKYFNMTKMKFDKCTVVLEPFIHPIPILYPAFEKVDYMVFGGMVFTNLSRNYIFDLNPNDPNKMKMISILKNIEECLKPRLCLTTILNNKISMLHNISKGDIIIKVNNIDVYDIKSLKRSLNSPIIINKEKYIKIDNDKGRSIIAPIKELYEEDKMFSTNYKYEISNIYTNLMKK